MKKLIILFFILAIKLNGFAQFLDVTKTDTTNYPEIRANFYAINKQGQKLDTLRKEDFSVKENGSQTTVIEVINPKNPKITKSSFVLTLDVSGSTDGKSIEIEKKVADEIIKRIPLDICEMALTTFNDQSFPICDFTKNQEKLLKHLETINSGGGTDYDKGIMEQSGSSVSLLKNARYRGVIIFISDGYGSGSTSEIINLVSKTNARFYAVITNEIPVSIKEVVEKQQGLFFEKITTDEQIKEAISKIILHSLEIEPSTIIWKAIPSCSNNILVQFETNELSGQTEYQLSDSRITGLTALNPILNYGPVTPGEKLEAQLIIKAQNIDCRIDSVKGLNPEWFKVSDTLKFPIYLKKNQTTKIPIVFTPLDSGIVVDQFKIYNSACNEFIIYTKGGFRGIKTKYKLKGTLKVTKPNGGEQFTGDALTNITWQGISANQEVQISYSTDKGLNWIKDMKGIGLTAKWKVPCYPTTDYLIKVEQFEPNDKPYPIFKNQKIIGSNANESLFFLSNAAYDFRSFTPLYLIPSGADSVIVNNNNTKVLLRDSSHIRLADAKTGTEIFKISAIYYNKLHLSKNGKYIIGTAKKTTAMFDAETGKKIYESPKGFENYNGALFYYKVKGKKHIVDLKKDDEILRANSKTDIKFSPYSTMYSVLDKKRKKLTIFDSLTTIALEKENVGQVHFMPNGRDILCIMKNNIVQPNGKTKKITQAQIFNIKKDSLLLTLEGQYMNMNVFTYSADTNRIISNYDGYLQIADLKTGKLIFENKVADYQLNNTATLIAIPNKNETEIYTTGAKILLHKFKGTNGQFSNNSDLFLTISSVYTTFTNENNELIYKTSIDSCYFWDLKSGKNFYSLFDNYAERKSRSKPYPVMKAYFNYDDTKIITDNKNAWRLPGFEPVQSDISDSTFTVLTTKSKIIPVEFNRVPVGDWEDKMIKNFVTNNTKIPVTITGIAIRGEAAEEFILKSTPPPFTLQPGTSKDVEFAFHPLKDGKRSAQIEVSSCSDVQITQISGTGYKIDLDIIKTIDFKNKKINSQTDTVIAFVKNTGSDPVTLTNIGNMGPDKNQFFILSKIKNNTILPGEKMQIEVRFAPTERGQTSAMLGLKFKEFESIRIIKLLGNGAAPRFVTVKGFIYNTLNNRTLSAKIIVTDLETKREIYEIQTGDNGKFLFELDMDRNYSVTATKDKFLPGSVNIDLTKQIYETTIEKNLYLSPFEVGGTSVLNNIFFDTGKSNLKPESYQELDRILNILKANPVMEIEISGHTDNTGTKENNVSLSQNRAEAVANYLIKKGINSSRITANGYADSKPIGSNETEEGRQKNRRVEMTVKKK